MPITIRHGDIGALSEMAARLGRAEAAARARQAAAETQEEQRRYERGMAGRAEEQEAGYQRDRELIKLRAGLGAEAAKIETAQRSEEEQRRFQRQLALTKFKSDLDRMDEAGQQQQMLEWFGQLNPDMMDSAFGLNDRTDPDGKQRQSVLFLKDAIAKNPALVKPAFKAMIERMTANITGDVTQQERLVRETAEAEQKVAAQGEKDRQERQRAAKVEILKLDYADEKKELADLEKELATAKKEWKAADDDITDAGGTLAWDAKAKQNVPINAHLLRKRDALQDEINTLTAQIDGAAGTPGAKARVKALREKMARAIAGEPEPEARESTAPPQQSTTAPAGQQPGAPAAPGAAPAAAPATGLEPQPLPTNPGDLVVGMSYQLATGEIGVWNGTEFEVSE